MSKKALQVRLIPEDKTTLLRWASAPTSEQRFTLRARIVLAAAGGEATRSIADRERVRRATVSKWRRPPVGYAV